ncbi:MAG: WGR domain-containing protein [Gammaproteobacteria bacterium]|nr:WGR domain-containing protein [Gammaproteobacteria bacterium]
MRIYLQIPAGDEAAPRFYHLILQQDLLEGWTLVKEWGQVGRGTRLRREHYPSREAAEQALIEARDAQLRRGYRVVFAQGTGGTS